jgi:hypothetical protein
VGDHRSVSTARIDGSPNAGNTFLPNVVISTS